VGLIFAPLFLLIGALALTPGRRNDPAGGGFSFGIALLLSVFYGVIEFIVGLVGALFYNLLV
jgi:hypothetical protein